MASLLSTRLRDQKLDQESRAGSTGADVVIERAYDPLGREFRTSLPRRAGESVCWTFKRFDYRNRVIKEWAPGPGNSTMNPAQSCGQSALGFAAALPTGGHLRETEYDNTTLAPGHVATVIRDRAGDAAGDRTVVRIVNVMDRLLELREYPNDNVAPGQPFIATVYDYDPVGNNTYVRDPDGFETRVLFSSRNFKTQLQDPNLGTWDYTYDVLGQLIDQIQPRLDPNDPASPRFTTRHAYDEIGRMTSRTDRWDAAANSGLREVTEWYYDEAGAGKSKGLVTRVVGPYVVPPSGPPTVLYQESYTYDDFARPQHVVRRVVEGSLIQFFWTSYAYDDQGRVSDVLYPAFSTDATATYPGSNRRRVGNEYNDRGALAAVRSRDDATVYWTMTASDPLGNVTAFSLGNGVTTTRMYDYATGLMLTNGSSLGAVPLTNEQYEWELRNRLRVRRDLATVTNATQREEFTYDTYDRVATTTVTYSDGTSSAYSNGYTNSGRITQRGAPANSQAAMTNYGYGAVGGPRPHAVKTVTAGGTARTYNYDSRGNMVSDTLGRAVTWSPYNKPIAISRGSEWSEEYRYGPARELYRRLTIQSYTGCNAPPPRLETTLFIGAEFEVLRQTIGGVTTTEYRHYIQAGGVTVALHKERSNGTRDLIYLHHDYLGTVVAMTRGMGAQIGSILERQSFDPWGKKRSPQLATPMAGTFLSASANVSQGFTGHLQLGSSEAGANTLGFIHMGGRVYDPEIGRFLSPDPVLQFPESTQGFDRYAYVQNNPVSLTDPTGHLIAEIAAIAKVAWGVMTTKAVIQASVFAYSVVTGYMNGGIKGALFAVAGAGLSFGVGSLYSAGAVQSALGKAGTFFLQASTHGLVQGGLAAAQGGKFGAGFMSGFAGSSMGSVQFGSAKFQLSGLGRLTRVLQSAIAGGTASTLGGGKFANGAISGAIIMAWNHMAHAVYDQKTGTLEVKDADTGKEAKGQFYSGTGSGDELPKGRYKILQRGSKDGFRLEPMDENFGDDVHGPTGRDLFRLHGPGRSNGCLTAVDKQSWLNVEPLIRGTSTTNVTVNAYKTLALPGGYSLGRIQVGTEEVKFYGVLEVR